MPAQAAKVAAAELRKILTQVKFPPSPPNLVIDSGTFDDAAIFKINDDLALVQTLDFFTPIVDTPRTFGKNSKLILQNFISFFEKIENQIF